MKLVHSQLLYFGTARRGLSGIWCFSSVPNLVQIWLPVAEIDALLSSTFVWWRHAN